MNKMGRFDLEKLSYFLWGVVLLTLPVTSFRYFPFLGKYTYVRPLAFYPLVLLYLVLSLRLLRKEIKLPWNDALLPFFLFLLFALITTAAGAFLAPVDLRGNDYWGRALRTFLTFVVGLSFFVAALWMNRSMDDVRRSLPWLYTGLVLTVLWSGIQVLAFYTPLLKKGQVSDWQLLFSMRGLPKIKRVSGFAFEASWLGGQLAILYLPWLVSSLLARFRATRFRWLEPLLFLLAVITLLLTYSRGGLLIVLVAVGVTVLVTGQKLIKNSWQWFFHPARHTQSDKARTLATQIGLRILIVMLFGAALWAGYLLLVQREYFTSLWENNADSLADYFIKAKAGGRITYLLASVRVFLQHPISGTGFGGSGFYIFQNLPDWALSNMPEITEQLAYDSRIYPNPKNLYIRLLAENGLFGFIAFLIFLLAVFSKIVRALRDDGVRMVGIAGLFTWTAIIIYYFMQDSFAMAELWVNFGIILGITNGTAKTQRAPRKS
jgi:O-antigen ligase